MWIVAGPAARRAGTVKVAVSAAGLVVTVAGCVRPPASTVTSPNVISAAFRVMAAAGWSSRISMSARPRKVAASRSGANHSV